jgi:hypothetical protein
MILYRRAAAMLWWTATSVVLMTSAVRAHSGPPFPIVSNQLAGPYQYPCGRTRTRRTMAQQPAGSG